MYYIPTSNHPTVMDEVKKQTFSQASGKYKIRILFPSSSISHRSLSAERHILNILPGRGTWQPILEWRTNATIYTPLLILKHTFSVVGINARPQGSERFCCSSQLCDKMPWKLATWLQTIRLQWCLSRSCWVMKVSTGWHFWEFLWGSCYHSHY